MFETEAVLWRAMGATITSLPPWQLVTAAACHLLPDLIHLGEASFTCLIDAQVTQVEDGG